MGPMGGPKEGQCPHIVYSLIQSGLSCLRSDCERLKQGVRTSHSNVSLGHMTV